MKKEDEKRPEKEENTPAVPIFLNSEENLTLTIKDGDYTLREGVDYKVRYYRAMDDEYPGNVCWVVLLEGLGKYNRTLFYGAEMSFPVEKETLNDQAEMETFCEHIRSTRENGGSF